MHYSIIVRAPLVVLAALVTLIANASSAAAEIEIRVISSRPDMVSGNIALVEISGLETASGSRVLSVVVNGRDVASSFRATRPAAHCSVESIT